MRYQISLPGGRLQYRVNTLHGKLEFTVSEIWFHPKMIDRPTWHAQSTLQTHTTVEIGRGQNVLTLPNPEYLLAEDREWDQNGMEVLQTLLSLFEMLNSAGQLRKVHTILKFRTGQTTLRNEAALQKKNSGTIPITKIWENLAVMVQGVLCSLTLTRRKSKIFRHVSLIPCFTAYIALCTDNNHDNVSYRKNLSKSQKLLIICGTRQIWINHTQYAEHAPVV